MRDRRRLHAFDHAPPSGRSGATDPHWPAQLAALVVVLLYLTLPEKLTVGPCWLVPALEALLLVALVLATPGDEVAGSQACQRLAVAFVGVVALATLVALGLLAHFVVEGGRDVVIYEDNK